MKIDVIISRLESAFYDFNTYVEGGEVYRYYGFQNAFVLVSKLVGANDGSETVLYRIGRCCKLAMFLHDIHLKAFYIPRTDNPHKNMDFLKDCEELKFVCYRMKSFLVRYSKDYGDEITDVESVLKVEDLLPSIELTSTNGLEGLIPVSEKEAQNVCGGYKIAENRKTDFLKVFTAMIECSFFEKSDGIGAVCKKDFFNEIGKFLNTSFTYHNNLMSKAKFASEESYMKPFDEIADKAKERYDKI